MFYSEPAYIEISEEKMNDKIPDDKWCKKQVEEAEYYKPCSKSVEL